ncbi:MAG: hypothetical protein ACT4OS_10225 [Acidimicrobiales bacterium]
MIDIDDEASEERSGCGRQGASNSDLREGLRADLYVSDTPIATALTNEVVVDEDANPTRLSGAAPVPIDGSGGHQTVQTARRGPPARWAEAQSPGESSHGAIRDDPGVALGAVDKVLE